MHADSQLLAPFVALAAAPGCFCALPGQGARTAALSADPFAVLEITRSREARLRFRDGKVEALPAADPAATLDYVLGRFRIGHASGAAPGCALAISYEAGPWFAPVKLRAREGGRDDDPLLVAALYENAICRSGGALRVAGTGFARGRDDAARHRAWLEEALAAAPMEATASAPAPAELKVESSLPREEYLAAVARVQEYIAAGDIYQANLTQRLSLAPCSSPAALWRALVSSHPTPWSTYFDMGAAGVLLSNSPECFLRRRGNSLETFPIKGTRASESAPGAIEELQRDEKELAEHRMIVDLERSDFGRVAQIGSVSVPAREYVESYGTVHHLVSCVRAQVGAQRSLGSILSATFPGGSITGAPKKRAMEIIDELEPAPRGFYTGALGTVSASGDFDLSILIRMAHQHAGALHYHCGGGIVADSVPGREVDESWLKARAFLRACGLEGISHGR